VAADHAGSDTDADVLRSSPDVVKRLCEAARAVAANSYSPYSGYRVGAAVDAAGQTFVGTNVENSSYPAGVCAERVALGAVISAGFRHDVTALALYAEATKAEFVQAVVTPCGICLQWLAELTPDIEILVCEGQKVTQFRVSDLLRRPFRK
jgi:cytidine deaminase